MIENMKSKPFLFILPLFFILCASLNYEKKRGGLIYNIDFTRYEKQGFLISPNCYTGKYTGLRMVGFAKYQDYINYEFESDTVPKGFYKLDKLFRKELPAQIFTDSLYAQAKRIGADAIINFRIEVISRTYGQYREPLYGFNASGYAIKREN